MNTYPSIAALCRAEKIDRKLIRAASAMGLKGFNSNRSINWTLLESELKAHEAELKQYLGAKSMDDLRREEKELGNELKKLEIKKKQGTYIDPEDFYQWHSEFGVKLSTSINVCRKNLMTKCRGYESIIDSEMLAVFALIKAEIEKCKE